MRLWHVTFASGFFCGALFVACCVGAVYLFVRWRQHRSWIAYGARLYALGERVGLPRPAGISDDRYREAIRQRIGMVP